MYSDQCDIAQELKACAATPTCRGEKLGRQVEFGLGGDLQYVTCTTSSNRLFLFDTRTLAIYTPLVGGEPVARRSCIFQSERRTG
jgi:hypothetical protein